MSKKEKSPVKIEPENLELSQLNEESLRELVEHASQFIRDHQMESFNIHRLTKETGKSADLVGQLTYVGSEYTGAYHKFINFLQQGDDIPYHYVRRCLQNCLEILEEAAQAGQLLGDLFLERDPTNKEYLDWFSTSREQTQEGRRTGRITPLDEMLLRNHP